VRPRPSIRVPGGVAVSTDASSTRVRSRFWVLAATSIPLAVLAAVALRTAGGAASLSADPVPFRISGDVSGLVPGVPADVPLTLENPNAQPIYVTSIVADIDSGRDPPGCASASHVSLEQPTGITSDAPATVPGHGAVVLRTYPSAPRITLRATAADDDACKGTSFVLAYTGSAHS
jgi:hypothetical protein